MKHKIILFCKRLACTLIGVCVLPACEQGLDRFPVRLRPASFNEARLVDMPFPLGIELKELAQKEENKSALARYSVSFETGETVETLFSFYQVEMERLGWQMVSTFWLADNSLTLLFERPSKNAIIIITPAAKKLMVVCHIARRGNLS